MKATRTVLAFAAVLTVGGLTACSAVTSADAPTAQVVSEASSGSLWDSLQVHDIQVTIADADLQTLLETYASSGEKIWVTATVTIDGTTFENVGIKLKGNSTLRGVSTESDPTTLPWLIRLDKYVDDQNYDGETELVVRGNNSETALNEAVALDLLSVAGLASEEAISSRFSVNGTATELRLVIQNPDDDWAEQEFGETGLLYKAEAGGDYSYRGEDPASYADVFEQEAGDENLQPLIDFLKFINESDDETFTAELGDHLDVASFATYLAFQDFVDNFDDIDGPGNNSYLRYDETTGLMTVVNWDLNLAFGVQNGGGGGAGNAGGMPAQGDNANRPQPGGGFGGAPGGGAAGGGARGGSNVLAQRFTELFPDEFAAAQTALAQALVTSGAAQEVLDEWTSVLTEQASDLVPASTVEDEASSIAAYFR